MKRLLNTPHIYSSSGKCCGSLYSLPKLFTKSKWTLLAIYLLAANLSGQSQIASDQFNRGFEDGNNSGTNWLVEPFGPGTLNYANANSRTGAYAGSVTTNSTTAHVWRNSNYSISVNAGEYVHMLAWYRAASNTGNRRLSIGVKGGAAPYNNSGNVRTPTTTYVRDVFPFRNSTAAPVAYTPYFRSYISSGSTSVTIIYDDIVMYTSNSSTTDVTDPTAAGCLSASKISPSGISLHWTNGTDAATGIRGTLVLRLTGNSGAAPALNDQGTYTTAGNPVTDGVSTIGSWTVIADLAAGVSDYTDNSIVAGTTYRYTIIHYDLALNYSTGATPLNVTAAVPANIPRISQSVANLTRPTGGTFQPGDLVQIKVIVDQPGGSGVNPIFNLKTRINVDTKFTYQANSMQVKDNKGQDFTTAALPPNSSCGFAYTQQASSSGLTDAAGDDKGQFFSGGSYAEIMLGEKPNGSSIAQLEAGTNLQWGGRVRGTGTIPSYYNSRSIVVASINVQIPVTATIGDTYDISSSTIYSLSEFCDAANLTTFNINSTENSSLFTQIVVSDPTLPASYSTRGANLFTAYTNGTFGGGTDISGAATLTSSDLTKTTIATNAPGDGFYAITKNTSGVQTQTNNAIAINSPDRVFTHLYILGDHTGTSDAVGNNAVATTDSGGYMLLVNADYIPTRIIDQTITDLCPGTYYNFKAWFRNVCPSCGVNSNQTSGTMNIRDNNPLDTDPRRQGVKPSLTFDVNNKAYYTTGSIDTSDNWALKEFVFATGASSGDFNFSIRNNSPGGDGNDWVLDDISIITRGPSASVAVDADPVIDPDPSAYCIGQRFQIVGNWIENTGSFTQYDSYQFQYSYGPNGPWNSINDVSELPAPNDPYNPTNGWLDSVITQQFLDANQDVYFRVVVATQPSNISLDDAAPCQITAYNSSVIRIGTCLLPIKLLRFKAASFGQQVFLNWAAADINRLQYYVIERSSDGVNFAPVKQIDAKAFASPYQYQLVDQPNASSDRLWYRLKMVHLNNEITFSNIETVGWRKAALSLSIQPNPARDVVQLNWSGVKPNQKIQLTINTVSGRSVHSETITVQEGPTQTLRLPALPAGLYILQVEDPTSQYRQTIKLNKL